MTGFIGRFGHVQYTRVMREGTPWRSAYAADAACEFDLCRTGGGYGTWRGRVVFDHCHRHGWVRGLVCGSHNTRLGRLEAVLVMEGVTVELGDSPYGRFLARCPDCLGDPSARLPAKGPFGPEPPWLPRKLAWLAARPVPQNPIAVRRPGALRAHITGDGRRTMCGCSADAMVPAAGVPACRICTSALERLRRATDSLTDAELARLAEHAAITAARSA